MTSAYVRLKACVAVYCFVQIEAHMKRDALQVASVVDTEVIFALAQNSCTLNIDTYGNKGHIYKTFRR